MTDREINLLNTVCRMTGTDPTTITAENPAKKSGKTAQMLMAYAGEIDPEQAAIWRQEAGAKLSVATLAELGAGGALSPAAHQELWDKDPTWVVKSQRAMAEKAKADEQKQQQDYEALRFKNAMHRVGGDEAAARRLIEGEDALNAQHEQRRLGVMQ